MGSGGAQVEEWIAQPLVRPDPLPPRPLKFDEIYADFFDHVSRWIRVLGGPDADREDLLQDVFVIVHRRLRDFDGQNLPGWLYQITRHRVRDFRRLRWFRVAFQSTRLDQTILKTAVDPEMALGEKESEAILDRLLSTLPDTQRAAFVLFEIEGYSGKEIAQLQSVPINTVWARIHKARMKLVAHMTRLQRHR